MRSSSGPRRYSVHEGDYSPRLCFFGPAGRYYRLHGIPGVAFGGTIGFPVVRMLQFVLHAGFGEATARDRIFYSFPAILHTLAPKPPLRPFSRPNLAQAYSPGVRARHLGPEISWVDRVLGMP
jgi:hypothetical protein